MNAALRMTLIAALGLSALSQTKVGQPVPVPAEWIRNGRLVVPDYNFSIASPTPGSRWSYTEGSLSDEDKGVVFIVEYLPGSKYVVTVTNGDRGIDVDHPEEFVKGMQKTLPKDWSIEDAHFDQSDIPTKNAEKFKVKLNRPGESVFYLYGYIVAGRRNFLIEAYSKEGQEPVPFGSFVASFSLLSPAANALPPAPPHSGVIGIMVIVAIAGAVIDRRYKRGGGRRPTAQDHACLWAAVGLCVAILILLGVRGCTAEELGGWMADLLMLLFAFWELGRWFIRRKYPLGPSAVQVDAS